MNEARIRGYIFLGERGVHMMLTYYGYLMMMLDYKGGKGGQESGKK